MWHSRELSFFCTRMDNGMIILLKMASPRKAFIAAIYFTCQNPYDTQMRYACGLHKIKWRHTCSEIDSNDGHKGEFLIYTISAVQFCTSDPSSRMGCFVSFMLQFRLTMAVFPLCKLITSQQLKLWQRLEKNLLAFFRVGLSYYFFPLLIWQLLYAAISICPKSDTWFRKKKLYENTGMECAGIVSRLS